MVRLQILNVSLLFLLSFGAQAQNNAAEMSSLTDDDGLCLRVFRRTVTAYQNLSHLLGSNNKLPPASSVSPLLTMQSDDCNQTGGLAKIERSLSQHSGKIALLLPLALFPKSTSQELIKQVQGWLQSRGIHADNLLIWRDTAGSKGKLEAQLAQVVLQEQVALLIGGLMQQEAPVLAQWSNRLRIPAIILNRKPDTQHSKYAFYLGPDFAHLASAMNRFAISRKLQRVAILEPQHSHDSAIIVSFRKQMEQRQAQVIGPLVYNPTEYSSIDGVLRKLFHIDDDDRKEELLDLVNQRRTLAKEQGETFDASKVMLPAILDVDAIVIADHFKNVRHISKSLLYYGVKKVQLIGVPRWRAFEIIDPPDANVSGAVFVDYIGGYQQMPYGIKVPMVDNEFFAEGAEAGIADLKLVVHHAIFAAIQALTGDKPPRYALYRRLEAARGPQQGFLNLPMIFRPDHTSYWPSFLFGIGMGSVSLMQTWNPDVIPLPGVVPPAASTQF